MSTSGTVAQTAVDVMQLIESATRRCGKVSSTLTSEQVDVAKRCLFWALVDLTTNHGMTLWCISRLVVPLNAAQTRYTLPAGVESLHNNLLRRGSYSTGAAGAVTYSADTAVLSASATVSAAGTYTLALDSSPDGATWTPRGSAGPWTLSADSGLQMGVDAEAPPAALQWRVRIVSGPVAATVTASTFVYAASDTPMSQLSRDDYANYPNKASTSAAPLQLYFDRQTPHAQIVVWPVPSLTGPQMILWVQRQVQDVGALTNTLDLPQRWQRATMLRLACELMQELPASDADRTRWPELKGEAAEALMYAENAETDGAPVTWMPNIGGYSS